MSDTRYPGPVRGRRRIRPMAAARPAAAAHGPSFWRLALLLTLALPLFVHAHKGDGKPYGKPLTAVRIRSTPPTIDGVLDDPVWRAAPVFSGFTQWKPDEGQPSQERTTVRLAYDDAALYVAVMAYDRQPHRMVARPTRRDVLGEAGNSWSCASRAAGSGRS